MTNIANLDAKHAALFPRNALQKPSFERLDANADGGVTIDELKAGAPGGARGLGVQKHAEALFKALDVDGNGSVSSDEKDAFDTKLEEQRQSMQFLTQQLGALQPSSNEDVFKATDDDGDGAVSLAEFSIEAEGVDTEQLQNLFDLIDVNKDGSINRDESSSFLDAVRTAVNDRQADGPPPGALPPPPEGDTAAAAQPLDLLNAARTAYTSTTATRDLLSVLTSIFDTAA